VTFSKAVFHFKGYPSDFLLVCISKRQEQQRAVLYMAIKIERQLCGLFF